MLLEGEIIGIWKCRRKMLPSSSKSQGIRYGALQLAPVWYQAYYNQLHNNTSATTGSAVLTLQESSNQSQKLDEYKTRQSLQATMKQCLSHRLFDLCHISGSKSRHRTNICHKQCIRHHIPRRRFVFVATHSKTGHKGQRAYWDVVAVEAFTSGLCSAHSMVDDECRPFIQPPLL